MSNARIDSQAMQRAEDAKKPTLRGFLERPEVQQRLAEVAANFMTPAEMTRFALLAATKNNLIAECTQESILRCLLDAAAVKIRPGGFNGRGWIVPRKVNGKWEAFFDPGYRGLLDIARRSGNIGRVSANAVRENDIFEYSFTPFPMLRHEPFRGKARGRVIAAYAAAEIKGTDGFQMCVLEEDDLNRIAAMSPAGDKGPWGKWDDEMSMKSAVRRLTKLLPVEDQDTMDRAIAMSDSADGVEFTVHPAGDAAEVPRAKVLASKLREKAIHDAPAQPPPPEEATTDFERPPSDEQREALEAEAALRAAGR